MHGWETRMLLKYYLERGVSKAELSRRFGVSRRTIHEWVETGQLDRDLSSGGSRYAPRPPAPHKLDPYTGVIDARLEEYPGLSAQRLFDEVRAAGYPGGYSRVRDYVRAVRPREPTESVVRFETPAGRQGQVDFATFTLPWGRRHALVVVLSHSRLLWLCFYRRLGPAARSDAGSQSGRRIRSRARATPRRRPVVRGQARHLTGELLDREPRGLDLLLQASTRVACSCCSVSYCADNVRKAVINSSVDGSKPAICRQGKTGNFRRQTETSEFYFEASSVRKSVWTLSYSFSPDYSRRP